MSYSRFAFFLLITHIGFFAKSLAGETGSPRPVTGDDSLNRPSISSLQIRLPQAGVGDLSASYVALADGRKLMLLGNSITVGKFADNNEGYRNMLYDMLSLRHYGFEFVGFFGEKPYYGHFEGGRKIGDFYSRNFGIGGTGGMDVAGSMDHWQPDIVVIHLGTNDMNDGGPVVPYKEGGQLTGSMVGRLAWLVRYLLDWHNGARGNFLDYILVSQIIPLENRIEETALFAVETARMVRDYQHGVVTGSEEPVYLCDVFTPFWQQPFDIWEDGDRLMADNLHPNTSGHLLMAKNYLNKIEEIYGLSSKWFTDSSWETGLAGIDSLFGSQGIAVADVNGNGLDDVFISRIVSGGEERDWFFENQSNALFDERAAEAHISDEGGSRGVIFVDIDNDGDFDLFNGHSPGGNRLYRNNGSGLFDDITAQAGIEPNDFVTTTVLAFDCENDGDMDLFALTSRDVNELYVNSGQGQFTRQDRGLNDVYEPDIPSTAASAADYDGDGDVDVYVAKRGAPNKLFVNDGFGYFTDRAAAAGVNLVHDSNSAVWSDLDNDGDPDLLVTVSDTPGDAQPLLRVFKNKGDGTFEDISTPANIPANGFSTVVGDFDNDGDLDIITTSDKQEGGFYENRGQWQFAKVADSGAEIFAGDVRGAAVLDYDDDGDADFIAARADVFNAIKKNNLGNGRNYLKIRAYGPSGNLGGFGTKIWLFDAGYLGQLSHLLGFREIVSASGHQSQSSPVQHFGLDSNGQCDLLARFADGTFVAMRSVQANRTLTIRPEKTATQFEDPASISMYGGDGQSAPVTQQLEQPIEVRVRDQNQVGVAGIEVEFDIIAGDAQLLLPIASRQTLWLEAESGRLGEGMKRAYDQSSSGDGYVFVEKENTISGTDTLSASVTQDGSYYLWLRALNSSPNTTMNVYIDQNLLASLPVNYLAEWQWIKGSAISGDFLPVSLPAGEHKLIVEFKGTGLSLDKLLLTADVSYVPTGAGDDAEYPPQQTDRQGIARRFVQPGTDAGPIAVEASLFVDGSHITGSPVRFNLTALPGQAVRIDKSSGDGQVGEAGVPLAEPFVVTVSDQFGNAVPGEEIAFEVVSGGGSLDPPGTIESDQNGRAATVYTPGEESSVQRVKASAPQI
ncbi:hypothetical protein A2V82_14890, partial [candidate division KSB1 bacterium RBG_16_48_16]